MAFVPHAAAAAAAAQKRILKTLAEAGAISASSAVPLDGLKGFDAKCLDRLARRGLVHQGKPGTYWVDEGELAAFEARQRNAVIIILGILTAIVAWLILSGHT